MRLPYPDQLHLDAAVGWLMLGDLAETSAEFQRLSRAYEHHPDYLQVKCRLLISGKEWEPALAISKQQLRIAADRPQSWINHAYCLHELNRTREAVDLLRSAARRFPKHHLISYNLACYFCHLQRFNEALRWVNRTADLVDADCAV